MLPKRVVECGRKSLIGWVNKQLSLGLPDLNCLADGSIYCHLVNKLQTNIIPQKKIRENPTSMGYLHNYKLLQNAFFVLGVNKVIPVEQLMAHNSRALQMFTCWFKCFFELNNSTTNKTLRPFDLDTIEYRSEGSNDLNLWKFPKNKERFRRKERTGKRRKKTSRASTEKYRCQSEGIKEPFKKGAKKNRDKCPERETWDMQSAVTYNAESQEDLYKLSDLSLAPTEKDSLNETEVHTCSSSVTTTTVSEIQQDEIDEQHKGDSKKKTEGKLRRKNVSKTLEKATNVSSEAGRHFKYETIQDFETGTSLRLLGGKFTGQEPGTLKLSRSSTGPLNEVQLLKEILAEDHSVAENPENLSKGLTEPESKLKFSLETRKEINDLITKPFPETLEAEELSVSDSLEPDMNISNRVSVEIMIEQSNNFGGGSVNDISDPLFDKQLERFVKESLTGDTQSEKVSFRTGSYEDKVAKTNCVYSTNRDTMNLSKEASKENSSESCNSMEHDQVDYVDAISLDSDISAQNDLVSCLSAEVWQESQLDINPERCNEQFHISDETHQLTMQELKNDISSDQDCWSPGFLKVLAECIANGRKYDLVLFEDRYVVSAGSDFDPNEIGDSVEVLPVLESSSDSGEQDDELSYIDASQNVELFLAEEHVKCQT